MYKKHDVWGHEKTGAGYAAGHNSEKDKEHYHKGENAASYHKSELYNAHGDPSSTYNSGSKDKDEKKKKDDKWSELDEKIEKETKKEQEQEEVFKATKHAVSGSEAKQQSEQKKKSKSSIEEAIRKAMKEEKELVFLK